MIFINRLSIYLKIKSRKYLHPYNLCVKKNILAIYHFLTQLTFFFLRFCFVYKNKINKFSTLIFLTKCAFTLTILQQHLRQH